MLNETIEAADGGRFGAYVARPATTPTAAIVVIQEIFGVNQVMRELTDAYAALGYLAICPDIFWRIEPGIDITDQSEEEWKRAFELFQAFNVDQGVEDLKATIAHARNMDGSNGKVGTVGYCLGGKMAYLMATRSDADANVSFYGVGLDELLDESGNISTPYLSHIASEDGFVPKEAQEKISAGLSGNPKVTLHTYEGNDHAFARKGGAHYDEAAATLANQRTADFFAANLS